MPVTVIFGVIIMTSLGLWYQQIVLQSFLAERLIEQRALAIECRSLIPILIKKLDQLDVGELEEAKENFLEISENNSVRWRIDRSEHTANKIRFTFWLAKESEETLNLTVHYSRK